MTLIDAPCFYIVDNAKYEGGHIALLNVALAGESEKPLVDRGCACWRHNLLGWDVDKLGHMQTGYLST